MPKPRKEHWRPPLGGMINHGESCPQRWQQRTDSGMAPHTQAKGADLSLRDTRSGWQF